MTTPLRARILACLAAALLVAAVPAFSADKRFPLPEHGTFNVSIPAGWQDQVSQPQGLPPTIAFSPAKGKSFEVLVTPIWRPRPDVPIPTRETLRQRVENAAESFKGQSVETQVRLIEMQGKSGPGYYFTITDRAPKPDEYKFLTQGMVLVSELLVTFTILTNDGQEQVIRDALAMIGGASHAPQ